METQKVFVKKMEYGLKLMHIVLVSNKKYDTDNFLFLLSVDCGPLSTDSSELIVSYNSTLLGTVAYYNCIDIDNYSLIGVKNRTCTSTGQWSHQSPYCQCKSVLTINRLPLFFSYSES